MTAAELNALSARLTEAADEFSDHTSNDYLLEANTANKTIAIAALRYIESTGEYEQDWDDFAADIEDAEDEIEFFDNWLMAYMALRCKELAAAGGALSAAEQELINSLLDLVAEWEKINA